MFKDSVTPTIPYWSTLFLEMLTEIEKNLLFTCFRKYFFLSFGNILKTSCRNSKYFLVTPSQARRKEKNYGGARGLSANVGQLG